MGADQNIDLRRVAASALDWWRDAGVDVPIDEEPRNWLLVDNEAASADGDATAARRPATSAPAIVAPVEEKPLPATLAEFTAWRTSPDAPDHGWNTVRIGAQGSAEAGLMVLIEAPDREDEATGTLLGGAAGVLFDRMLAAIGRDRSTIYLASLAVARPAAGRITPEAIDLLAPIIRHHIALVAPKRLLVIGNAASRAVLGADIVPMRGNLHNFNHARGTSGAVASFHPRFLLERPAAKAEAWRDLQLLMKGIDA